MSNFDTVICYANLGAIRTSRWSLAGVSTKAAGNTDAGYLYMNASAAGDTLTIDLYKSDALTSITKVASGTASVAALPAKVSLSAANTSNLSGSLYVDSFAATTTGAKVLVSLITDADLAEEYRSLADLPQYDSTAGMASYCAMATRRILLSLSQMFADELTGPSIYKTYAGATQFPGSYPVDITPDYRRIAQPAQLRYAAVHLALESAMRANIELSDATMYSALAELHEKKFSEEMNRLNPIFNMNPDMDSLPDTQSSATVHSITRV